MNIFFLDNEPARAAQYHCDKHVVKMIVETAQILSTVVRIKRGYTGVFAWDTKNEEFGIIPSRGEKWKSYPYCLHGETGGFPKIYLVTHPNHPSVAWAKKSLNNFMWLLKLGYFLCDEYTRRYGKVHKSLAIIRQCEPNRQVNKMGMADPLTPKDFPYDFLTKPPLVMPEECQVYNDPVACYRIYYASYKKHLCTWKSTEPPDWFLTFMKEAKKFNINS